MKTNLLLFACSSLLIICACHKSDDQQSIKIAYDNGPTDSLKINQVQVIASHNSYHKKTDSAVFQFMVKLDSLGLLPSQYDPKGIDYSHLPLQEQLSNYPVRGLEIDIYNDPNGGQFYNQQGRYYASEPVASGIDELKQPGFKVLHIPDFDFVSTNVTFKSALSSIYNWSIAHPNHIPIFINIETKEETVADAAPQISGLTHSIPFDASAADNMDVEIKSVFGDNLDKVITPDKMRGSYPTLEAAALAGNWPRLSEARGKVIFIMQGTAESVYKSGHPSLQGRAMFVYSNTGTPEAAFVIMNDPQKKTQIQTLVSKGYMVRTRADDGTTQARVGDYGDMNAAFDGWAQIVSTDYYRADPRAGTTGWTDYHVAFPNGELARINGVSAVDKAGIGIIKE
jgi:hypothetical protein